MQQRRKLDISILNNNRYSAFVIHDPKSKLSKCFAKFVNEFAKHRLFYFSK